MKLEDWVEDFFKKRVLELGELVSFGETRQEDTYVAIFTSTTKDDHVVINFEISVSEENEIKLTDIKAFR